jgi:hypothetical protein
LFISLVFFIPKRYGDGKRFDVHPILFNFFKYSFQKKNTNMVYSSMEKICGDVPRLSPSNPA